MHIPYGYVPVYLSRGGRTLPVAVRDVVRVQFDSPQPEWAANPNCVDEKTCITNITASGQTAIEATTSAYSVAVYRAPSPLLTLSSYYPAYSGTCKVVFASTYYECEGYHKVTAMTDYVLRAGFVRSGLVLGSMDPRIDSTQRALMAVVSGNGSDYVSAAHGFMLEVACAAASTCSTLGVKFDPALGKFDFPATLGWALYHTKGAAPSPPEAPGIASIAKEEGFYGYVGGSAGALIAGLILCFVLYRRLTRQAPVDANGTAGSGVGVRSKYAIKNVRFVL